MQNENSRNTIIFFVCAALIMGVYYFMVMRPQAEMRRQAQVVAAEQKLTTSDAGPVATTGGVWSLLSPWPGPARTTWCCTLSSTTPLRWTPTRITHSPWP